VHLTGRL